MMSKNVSDKVTAAESLSYTSSTRSGQVYLESVSKAKVSYDIFTGNEIGVTGFLSMGKDDVDNSGMIKPAFLIRTLVKAYKTLAKEEPAMKTHVTREIAQEPEDDVRSTTYSPKGRMDRRHQQRNVLFCRQRSLRGKKTTSRPKTDPHQVSP